MGQSPDECSVIAIQKLGVAAEITITPTLHCGEMKVTCLSPDCRTPSEEPCLRPGEPCRFTFVQEISVAVPIRLGADVACRLKGAVCGEATAFRPDCGDGSSGSESGSDSSDSSS